MESYDFVIKLAGTVIAKTQEEAEEKINAHLDELGAIDSERYNLSWPDASWDLEIK